MSFKVTILELAPRWLVNTWGGKLLRTFGGVFDVFNVQVKEGIKARFPQHAPDDALGFIGNDRSIEKGPSESLANYRLRLIGAIDANRTRGSGQQLLKQLAGYFNGQGNPGLRLVSDRATWHEYNWGTGEVTKIKVGTNWNWDGLARWWRGWIIIDGAALGIGPPAALGSMGGTLDDGALIGCSGTTTAEVQAIRKIAQRWKPANVHAVRIIVTFNNSVFQRTNVPASNPSGNYDDSANWNPNATYWLSGGEEP